MAALLEVRNLRAGYGTTQVLHGLDFSIEQGTITTLLGANGAGKTTTLRALCNMIRASGEVRFAGERIDGRATEDIVRLGIAHVPDGRGTFTSLTTEENLRLGAFARRDKAATAQDYERVYRLFPILAERRSQQAFVRLGPADRQGNLQRHARNQSRAEGHHPVGGTERRDGPAPG